MAWEHALVNLCCVVRLENRKQLLNLFGHGRRQVGLLGGINLDVEKEQSSVPVQDEPCMRSTPPGTFVTDGIKEKEKTYE